VKLQRVLVPPVGSLRQRFDAVVCACGYEQRARACLDLLNLKAAGERIALAFLEHGDAHDRRANDRAFSREAFRFVNCAAMDGTTVRSLVMELLSYANADFRMLVDVSSMSKAWQAAIVDAVRYSGCAYRVEVLFMYVPGVLPVVNRAATPGQFVGPLDGFAGLGLPNLPLALVLGLGYEPERGLGLVELLDPKLTALFVPKRGKHATYGQRVRRNNIELLKSTGEEWIVDYATDDPEYTLELIESLAAGLQEDFRVVLVSLGPKIFGLLCLFAATRRRDLSVWRVSAAPDTPPRNLRPAISETVAVMTTWEPT
jgi:hypothetical protein